MKNLTATPSFRATTAAAAPAVPSGTASAASIETNLPESASLTKMRAPKDAAHTSGNAAGVKETISETMKEMEKSQQAAKSRDVDIAKKTFWRKALGVLAAGVGLGVAVATVVATGGAALAVAAASVALTVGVLAVADAWVARMSLKNAQARKDGQPQPYNLPMEGASATANLSCWCLQKLGVSDKTAKKIALGMDAGLRLGLMVTSAVSTLGLDAAISNADKAIPILTAAAGLLQSLADMKVDEERSKDFQEEEKHLAIINKQIEELEEREALKDQEIETLKTQFEAATKDLQARSQALAAPEEEAPLLQAEPVQSQPTQQEQAEDDWSPFRLTELMNAVVPREFLERVFATSSSRVRGPLDILDAALNLPPERPTRLRSVPLAGSDGWVGG
jgi:hypothetical protein